MGDKDGDQTSAEVTIKFKDVIAENLVLKEERDSLQEKIDKITKERDALKEVVSEDIRSRKVKRITDISNFTREDLDQTSLVELDTIEVTLKMAKREYTPIADLGSGTSKKTSLDSLYKDTPWGQEGR